MRKTFEVITDYNGIVLFDPVLLKNCLNRKIPPGENIFEVFSSTSLGDEVLKKGIVLPIMAIDDGGYQINISINESYERPESEIVFTNGIYPLHVASQLIVSDLAVLREWYECEDWIETGIPKGMYSVSLVGFSQHKEGVITNCGYDVNLTSEGYLPTLTANLEMSNQVMV